MGKKGLALFLATALLSTALAGCGGADEQLVTSVADSAAPATQEPAEAGGEPAGEAVNLVFLRAGTDDTGRQFWMDVIDGYRTENPGVEIEFQEAPWGNDIETKLNTAFASGTAPDVLAFNIASLGQRVPLGQYEPLDPWFENWEGKDDLLPAMKQIGMVGDTLYGMTYGPNPWVFMWRKDMFEAAGLDPDTPPTNWEELLEFHEKLTIKNGDEVIQAGISMPTSGTNAYQFYQTLAQQNGLSNLIDETTNELLFNTPEGIEALDIIRQIAEIGYIPYNMDNSDNNPFIQGHSAMQFSSVGDYNKAVENPEFGDIGVSGPLSKVRQATFCGANLFYITTQSQNKDAAWSFIEYNMTPALLWENFRVTGNPPVRASMEQEFIELDPELNTAIFEGISTGAGVAKVPYVWSVLSTVVTAIEKTVLGEATPEEAIREAATISQAEIDSL